MGSAYAKSWKKDMSDWERLYGNGVVYVSDGKMVLNFRRTTSILRAWKIARDAIFG